MSILAQLVIALAIFVAGGMAGIKWHAGQDAIAAEAERTARETDARQQRRFGDLQATRHVTTVSKLQNQLGNAREKIAQLSGRPCLDADTVGVLNATGVPEHGAAAGQPADPPAAAAAGTHDRSASDRDVAGYIALCRTRYAEVSDQVNRILDIEDARHPPAAAAAAP